MDHNRRSFPALLLLLACAVACTASTEPPTAASSPLTACSGDYSCTPPEGSAFAATLRRDTDGRCMMGSVELASDGRIRTDSVEGSWTGDANRFSLCVDGNCVTCAAKIPTTTGASCTGYPSSCSSRGPGYCSTIRGCRMATRVRYDGTYDNYCTGTPDACEDVSSESSCTEQGCDWK